VVLLAVVKNRNLNSPSISLNCSTFLKSGFN
jgi:hypothetical protein